MYGMKWSDTHLIGISEGDEKQHVAVAVSEEIMERIPQI